MKAVQKEMDEKLKKLTDIMGILHRCKYHKDRKDPEKGKQCKRQSPGKTEKDACLTSIQLLRQEYEVKCSESKQSGTTIGRMWRREYNIQLRKSAPKRA